jgi:hypothetical protein
MAGQPFSLGNLNDTGLALYGRGWQTALARDLHMPPRTVKGWCNGRALPDLRRRLADLCRQRGVDDPAMLKLAHKLEQLGPPE